NIDWGAHFGGFAFGLIACALIDLLEKANAVVLRCKFPEFVKVNALIIAAAIALVLAGGRPTAILATDGWQLLLEIALVCCLAVKACDLVLSLKHGLAIVVVALVLANAAVAWLVGAALAVRWACSVRALPMVGPIGGAPLDAACANLDAVLLVVAAAA